ncbi:hypothetical protein [Roseovarius sp.]|uniref:hypothetical protein n=1 Tax=Roseovarius sp. TaxID=1486281 RepID=UPI0025EED2F8|nr:hypothetical protein [Roseovarius sp.]
MPATTRLIAQKCLLRDAMPPRLSFHALMVLMAVSRTVAHCGGALVRMRRVED